MALPINPISNTMYRSIAAKLFKCSNYLKKNIKINNWKNEKSIFLKFSYTRVFYVCKQGELIVVSVVEYFEFFVVTWMLRFSVAHFDFISRKRPIDSDSATKLKLFTKLRSSFNPLYILGISHTKVNFM